jgi:predicted metal-binding protein
MHCNSFGCLDAVNENKGAFAQYNDRGGAKIVGLANCAGCPTLVAPEKILQKIRTMAASGVEALHISNCMAALCPYKNKYKSLIEENFPNMKVVIGTHPSDDPQKEMEMFKGMAKDMLTQPQKTMADLFLMLAPKQ